MFYTIELLLFNILCPEQYNALSCFHFIIWISDR